MTRSTTKKMRMTATPWISVTPGIVVMILLPISSSHAWTSTTTATMSHVNRKFSQVSWPPQGILTTRSKSTVCSKSCSSTRRPQGRLAAVEDSFDFSTTAVRPDRTYEQRQQSQLQFSQPREIRVERYARLPIWPVWAGVILFFVGVVAGPERASQLEHYLGGRVCPMILHQEQQMQDPKDGIIASNSDTDTRTTTSPFLLLVHHNHNFWKWDSLFRSLSKNFLPEGFPAHPHRGFTTLTYFLPDTGGGFVHRDSLGIRQSYGSTPRKKNFVEGLLSNGSDYDSKYEHIAQWLFTGAGLLHEEMFDLGNDKNSKSSTSIDKDGQGKDIIDNSRHELYQLWVNCPARNKMDPPRVDLLKRGHDIPIISTKVRSPTYTSTTKGNSPFAYYFKTQTNVAVIAGSYYDSESTTITTATAPTLSEMNILHVTMQSTKNRRSTAATRREQKSASVLHKVYFDDDDNDWKVKEIQKDKSISSDVDAETIPGWTYEIPANFDTLILYVRRGSCDITTVATSRNSSGETKDVTRTSKAPIHSTVFIEKSILGSRSSRLVAETIVITPSKLDETVDLLLLAGQPMYETYSQSVAGGFNDDLAISTTLEPVAMQGSMVMNYPQEVESAYRDYQLGKMGRPWDHELTDDEWHEHVRSFPCQYNYVNQRRERVSDYF